VYRGLIELLKSEHEIASIMSHEISHALLRHNAEKITYFLPIVFSVYLISLIGVDLSLMAYSVFSFRVVITS
jgi:metalloendopeptidase OMA1, mitochondrial